MINGLSPAELGGGTSWLFRSPWPITREAAARRHSRLICIGGLRTTSFAPTGSQSTRKSNLIQRIINDPRLQRERVYRSNDWLELTYSPNAAPSGTFNADVVVFDFPPGFDICNIIQPHLWLVPVDGREAVDGLMTALRTMKVAAGGLGVYAVPNMLDGAGRIPVNAVRDALGKVSGIKVWPTSIPDSGTIQRSAEFRAPTWRIPNGAGSAGDEAMKSFCTEVFRLTGLARRGR